ncbi:MAG: aminotransferase class I/II-fold pyridoxal phosphate-dependent enzyme [Anaerolineales bacterium]|nr:aminotransferase class I/II-fold pyridoxal phosphate-dependent enzyme [Anaerolineales bacterium]
MPRKRKSGALNLPFGRALKQIWKAMAFTGKSGSQVKREILSELRARELVRTTGDPLDYWARGHVPADLRVVDFLADFGVRRSNLPREWLKIFLGSAGYSEDVMRERERLAFEYEPPPMAFRPVALPSRSTFFIGRQAELAALSEALASNPGDIIVISGLPGTGKTAVAIEAGHACDGKPQGDARKLSWPHFRFIHWANPVEFEFSLEKLVDAVARRLRHGGLVRRPLEEKLLVLQDLLAEQALLLVIDNAEMLFEPDGTGEASKRKRTAMSSQASRRERLLRFLGQISGISRVILVSHDSAQSFAHAASKVSFVEIKVDGLPEDDALSFLRLEAGRLMPLRAGSAERKRLAAIQAEDASKMGALIRVTGGNPKALALCLGHIADQAKPLKALVAELVETSQSTSDIIHYLFSQAWSRCSEDARAAWLAMAFFVAPASEQAVSALTELPRQTAVNCLIELRSRSLIDVIESQDGVASPRYRTHPLMNAYAKDRLRLEPDTERLLRRRQVAYYTSYAMEALWQDRREAAYWNVLASRTAIYKIDLEWENLRSMLFWLESVNSSPDEEKNFWRKSLVKLVSLLIHYMDRRAYYPDRIRLVQAALRAATPSELKLEACWLLVDGLSYTQMEEENLTDAETNLLGGLRLAASLDAELEEEANDLKALGAAFLARVWLRRGNLEEASRWINQAHVVAYRPLVGIRVSTIAGEIASALGDHEAAIRHLKAALQYPEQHGDLGAENHYRLGFEYTAIGLFELAWQEFQTTLAMEGDDHTIEWIMATFGSAQVSRVRGHIADAKQQASSAREALQRVHPNGPLGRHIQTFESALEAEPRAGSLQDRGGSGDFLTWVKNLDVEAHSRPGTFNLAGSGIVKPVELLREIIRVAITEIEPARIDEAHNWGHPSLISAISRRYGITDQQRIIPSNGASLAYYLVCRTLISPGDDVVVESPAYDPLWRVPQALGAKIIRLNRHGDDFNLDPDELRSLLTPRTRLVCLTNLHNPTGFITKSEQLGRLAAVVARAGAFLLVEEVFHDFVSDQQPSASVVEKNTITINSLSKVYGLGTLRCGWIVAPPDLVENIRKTQVVVENIGSGLTQAFASFVIDELDDFQAHWQRTLSANHATAQELLAPLQGAMLEGAIAPNSCVYFPKVVGGSDTTELVNHLARHGVYVAPGHFFGTPERIRLGLGGDPEQFRRGLERFVEIVSKRSTSD